MRATSILHKIRGISSQTARSSSSKGVLSSRRVVPDHKQRESRAPRPQNRRSPSSSGNVTSGSRQSSRQLTDRGTGGTGIRSGRKQNTDYEGGKKRNPKLGIMRKDVYPSRYPEKSYRSPHGQDNRDTRSGGAEPRVARRKGLGYTAEMRKMAAEFAEMRKEELERFSQSFTRTSSKPKPSRPVTDITKTAKSSSINSSHKALSKTTTEAPAKSKESSKFAARFSSKKAPSRESLVIPVIQETPQFVCINKPPALLSQPGLPGEGTILDLLRFQRPDLTVQTVNRYSTSSVLSNCSLDKNTSGAMILGRTDSAIRDLNLLFKQNKIEKNVPLLIDTTNISISQC
jgi:hypothetical protein